MQNFKIVIKMSNGGQEAASGIVGFIRKFYAIMRSTFFHVLPPFISIHLHLFHKKLRISPQYPVIL